MTQTAIVALLRHTIGLNPDTVGVETIARAVDQRIAHCGASDTQVYLERLRTAGQELHALIEEVVIAETWFFRDRAPFMYLGRYITAEWLPTHQHTALRVLSVACSTGEEPYSIAMALLDTGLAPQRLHIDAVDISHNALRTAQRAVYGNHSFREEDLAFRQRYLEPSQDGYRVCDDVRSTVTFMHGNILDDQFLADKTPYDVIFCRNMLIYFDETAKSRANQALDRLLTPDGVLFVGYAETGWLLVSGYVPVPYPRAFAYRKADTHPDGQIVPQGTSRAQPHTSRGHKHQAASAPMSQRPSGASTTVGLSPQPATLPQTRESVLASASRLADQGDLDAAATLCETCVREYGPSAQAYVLLGLIRHAAGNAEQAEQCFNKAVYLQPDHYEALIHLALLLQHRGDTAGAAVLLQRAQRAKDHT